MVKCRSRKDLLVESFVELASTRPVYRITVADIIENCGVSRKTFYNLFQDKSDLVRYIYEKDAAEINSRCAEKSVFSFCIESLDYFKENITLYKNLSRMQGNDFYQIVYSVCTELITGNIHQGCDGALTPSEACALSIFCHGYAYKFVEWLSSPQNVDTGVLSQSIVMAWPTELMSYMQPCAC